MKEPCYYFGCIGRPGHYLFASPCHMVRMEPTEWPFGADGWMLDGKYPPPGREEQSVALVVHVDGWTVMAMWDRSVDRRGKCNSNFVAHGEHTFDEMVALAAEHFPTVWKRINDAAPVTQWNDGGMMGDEQGQGEGRR